MRIGIIGTGTISSAVVAGIAEDGHQISVSERSAANSARLAAQYVSVSIAANQAVLDQSDVIFLGLMADMAPGILAGLSFRPDHRVISLMAGVSLGQVAELVAPAEASAIVIPFPGVATGGSPVMVQGDTTLAHSLLGARNSIFKLSSDAELAAYMCAQAVLSPAVKMIDNAARWLSGRTGNTKQTEEFLRVLVGSSLLGSETAPLLAALDTPGGYNQRLREHMTACGMSAALEEGLDKLESSG